MIFFLYISFSLRQGKNLMFQWWNGILFILIDIYAKKIDGPIYPPPFGSIKATCKHKG